MKLWVEQEQSTICMLLNPLYLGDEIQDSDPSNHLEVHILQLVPATPISLAKDLLSLNVVSLI